MDFELLNYLQSFLTERRIGLFDKVLSERTHHFTVAVEDVYHLHNTSAVLRSCESFGIQNLHVIEEVNSKKIDREIAMGAQKWVDVQRHDSVKDCIAKLRSDNYQIVATSPHKDAHRLEEFDVTKKSVIFFGRETQGLSDLVLQEADDFIYIPMVGFTESLNISVSAAIILQYITTKLKQTDISWQLSDKEIFNKKLEWTRKMIKDIKGIEARYHAERS